ncbi:MAG: hypothetical protein CMI17_02620 [Opitutaceae bacterium]|nr:hypothetical protein [Opitutaceae bacterium]|tara:strand:- start:89 stop:325 length:237 start_codon:yes stop_codon:yes gene_type:complete
MNYEFKKLFVGFDDGLVGVSPVSIFGVKSVFDGGLDYIEVGRQVKVAGSEEAMVPDMSVLFFDSGASRVRRLIANKIR